MIIILITGTAALRWTL